jgi:hypothetical protein
MDLLGRVLIEYLCAGALWALKHGLTRAHKLLRDLAHYSFSRCHSALDLVEMDGLMAWYFCC